MVLVSSYRLSAKKLIKRVFASNVIAKFIWQIQNTPNFILKIIEQVESAK